MYAVIATGGKQEKVSQGQVLDVERLAVSEGGVVTFRPVLLVDEGAIISSPAELASATVEGKVLGEVKGKKIRGFTYKNKSNQRRSWGHRQKYTRVEITSITTKGK